MFHKTAKPAKKRKDQSRWCETRAETTATKTRSVTSVGAQATSCGKLLQSLLPATRKARSAIVTQ